jgi:hypothetical protein
MEGTVYSLRYPLVPLAHIGGSKSRSRIRDMVDKALCRIWALRFRQHLFQSKSILGRIAGLVIIKIYVHRR